MSERYDVIVAGVGSMGSATCYHLARRGLKVLGLERFGIPHGQGAHHGFSRLIRVSYFEHSDYVPLLNRAWDLWQQLNVESGEKVLHDTGVIYMSPPGGTLIGGSAKAAQTYALPHDRLDRAQLRAQYPAFEVPDDYEGMFDHKAGFLIPEKAVAAHAVLALQHGAELHGQERVRSWEEGPGSVRVVTDRGTYEADQIVFTGGAWTGELLRDLGIELTVTRQILGWLWPRSAELFAYGRFPGWVIEERDGEIYYGFPMMTDNPGFKVAHHWQDRPVDPETVDRTPTLADENDFRPLVRKYIPSADGPTLAVRICLYTNSPDSHFIIDRLPSHQRVTVGCGFSGHGFKFASVVGEVLADLATQGKTDLPAQFLGMGRFG